jgi:AraC family transcriptional regulator
VEARLGQDLQVADIAAQAGMSQWHFSRLFRLAVGESPAKWVLRRRCLQGARLLATTSESIASIAGRCGFSDPGYFAKAFGRLQGCSPRDFRRSGRWGGE